MSEISLIPETLTMTSREIAQLTGKDHRHVLADIRKMLTKLFGSDSKKAFMAIYKDAYGRENPCFNLPKREALIVLAKYRPEILSVVADKLNAFDEITKAIQDFEVPEECEGMYVYAIRNTTTGNVKLGISRNPENRLKQLQTGNDCTLELVAYRKAENRFQDESALHHAHSSAHIRGEWFDQSAAFAIAQ